mmetsp:Transcript_25496/g.71124  ORF Transcript_25496/g.71124 Transcript_25496/m.71124 type:complete len:209 (+) Transcript_25496:456-1082(+)
MGRCCNSPTAASGRVSLRQDQPRLPEYPGARENKWRPTYLAAQAFPSLATARSARRTAAMAPTHHATPPRERCWWRRDGNACRRSPAEPEPAHGRARRRPPVKAPSRASWRNAAHAPRLSPHRHPRRNRAPAQTRGNDSRPRFRRRCCLVSSQERSARPAAPTPTRRPSSRRRATTRRTSCHAAAMPERQNCSKAKGEGLSSWGDEEH